MEFSEEMHTDLSLGSMHLVHLIPRNMREVSCGVVDYATVDDEYVIFAADCRRSEKFRLS